MVIQEDGKKKAVFGKLDMGTEKYNNDVSKFCDDMTIFNSRYNAASASSTAPTTDSSGLFFKGKFYKQGG